MMPVMRARGMLGVRDRCHSTSLPPYLVAYLDEGTDMARICAVCAKGPVTGHNVSHAKNRTNRRWYPNLQTVRVLVDGAPRRIRVCAQCIKSNRVQKAS